MSAFRRLSLWAKRHGLIPEAVRRLLQRHMNMLEVRTASWVVKDPYAEDPPVSSYEPRYPYTLGILKEFWHLHSHYVAACRELGVAYKVLDISGPDWLEVIRDSGCDAFLIRPSVEVSIWKQMFDERLRVMACDLGKILFPSYGETWFYESKRRMHYWLEAHGVPHAKTWVFYDLQEALAFADRAALPLVYKSDLGSGASGVRIFRAREPLKRHLRRCFQRGFTTYRRCPKDREWGFVLLQEYLPDAKEWRMIRVGDSYFGYEKVRVGDFHSGSHAWNYAEPPSDLLDTVKTITDTGGFLSMDLDIFVTPDRRYLVNEMQTVFGMGNPYEMCVVGNRPGRMVLDPETGSWRFEAGSFCQNHMCNLRVETLLALLEKKPVAATREQVHRVPGLSAGPAGDGEHLPCRDERGRYQAKAQGSTGT